MCLHLQHELFPFDKDVYIFTRKEKKHYLLAFVVLHIYF